MIYLSGGVGESVWVRGWVRAKKNAYAYVYMHIYTVTLGRLFERHFFFHFLLRTCVVACVWYKHAQTLTHTHTHTHTHAHTLTHAHTVILTNGRTTEWRTRKKGENRVVKRKNRTKEERSLFRLFHGYFHPHSSLGYPLSVFNKISTLKGCRT